MSSKNLSPQPSPSFFDRFEGARKTDCTVWPGLERELTAYLEKRHPIDFSLLDRTTSGTRDFVQQALARAAHHGFTGRVERLRYLDLMIVLGAGFDRDPQLPWVGWRLAERPGEGSAIRPLWASAVAYVHEASGPHGGHYVRALLRARKLSSVALTGFPWTHMKQAAALLQKLYPEKLAVTERELGDFWQSASEHARRHSPGTRHLYPIYPVLMFLLGSHFESDPRYSWAGEALRGSGRPEPERYQALCSAAQKELDRVLGLLRRSRSLIEET